jgi:phosphate transport system substrate-binding protein
MRTNRILPAATVMAALALGATACGGDDEEGSAAGGGANLSGTIRIDGSSTVFPFAEAAAELFNEENPGVKITVGQSGTGGGFEKFCAGETDISNASRPIKPDEEAPACQKAGIDYQELQVANDGIAVVTNKDTAIDCLTTGELKKIWQPKSDVGDYKLFGPGTDSGTFDFFTDEINGEEGASREDYEASEDDNQLVTGVAGTPNGLAYFGFSYYEQNQDKLNLVAVDGGGGCIKPSAASIQDGSYEPLSRPLFMYPSAKALQRPEVKSFMDFLLGNQKVIAEAAQFVPMTEAQASAAKSKLAGT